MSDAEKVEAEKQSVDEYVARARAFKQPDHCFRVLPIDEHTGGEWWHEAGDVMTREKCLKFVAKLNRATWLDYSCNVLGQEWAIALELGRPLNSVLLSWSLFDIGIGAQEIQIRQPLRLVVATADEVKRLGAPPQIGHLIG